MYKYVFCGFFLRYAEKMFVSYRDVSPLCVKEV